MKMRMSAKIAGTNRDRILPTLIFLLAFFLRFLHLREIRNQSPFFSFPIMDAGLYAGWAEEIGRGAWMGKGAFWASPLYPYFLGGFFRVFGENFFLVDLVQSAAGSLSCLLIFYLGRRLFSRTAGLIAGLLAAAYGPFIFSDNLQLPTGLGILLNLSVFLLILRAMEKGGRGRFLLAGIVSGLAALARPHIILFLFLFPVWLAAAGGRAAVKTAGRNAAIFVLGALLAVAPATVMNFLAEKDLVFISWQGGLNFYLGNHPGANGTYRPVPGISDVPGEQIRDSRRIAEAAAGRPLPPSQVSRFWQRRALEFIRRHPGEWLRLCGRKFALFWNREEVDPQIDYRFQRRYSRLLRSPLPGFAIVSPLALVGIILSFRRRRETGIRLLQLFVAAYIAGLLLFFVTAQYRLPAVPFLLVFAGYAADCWALELRQRRFVRALLILFLAGALAILIRFPRVPPDSAPSYYQLGYAYEGQGMPEKAASAYQEAIRLKPDYVEAYGNLGRIYRSRGREEEALAAYRKALALDPGRKELYVNLGALYDGRGRWEEAAAAYAKALELDPRLAEAHNNLGAVYQKQGRNEEAIRHYRQALELDPGLLTTRLNLANLYASRERWEEAAAEYERILLALPDDPRINERLALVYEAGGRYEEAARRWEAVSRREPENQLAVKKMMELKGRLLPSL